MKKILMLALPLLFLLTSCRKDTAVVPPVDEGDWIYRERGVVVASEFGCPYFVVQAQQGYSLLKSWDGMVPYQGSVVYGDFSSWGVKRFYNRSEQYLIDADVRDYWMGYYEAVDEMEYQCYR